MTDRYGRRRRPRSPASSCVRTRARPTCPRWCASRTRSGRPTALGYRETVEPSSVAYFGHASEQFDAGARRHDRRGRRAAWSATPGATGSTPHDGVREYRTGGAVDPAGGGAASAPRCCATAERRSAALAARHARPTGRGCSAASPTIATRAPRRSRGARATSRCAGSSTCSAPASTASLPEIRRCPTGSRCDRSSRRSIAPDLARRHRGVPRPLGRRRRVGGERSAATRTRPTSTPSLWVVAWDGDEVAAAVVNTIYRARERGARPEARLARQRLHAARVAEARPRLARSSRAACTCWPSAASRSPRWASTPTTRRARCGCTSRSASPSPSAATPGASRWRRSAHVSRSRCRTRRPSRAFASGTSAASEDLPGMLRVYMARRTRPTASRRSSRSTSSGSTTRRS